MIFSSLTFIYAFFPVSLGLYHLTPTKYKNIMLFILSSIFCGMQSLYFLAFMLVYSAFNFFIGIAIERTSRFKILSVFMLLIGIVSDALVFLLFKSKLFDKAIEEMNIITLIVPIGISFFTLSAIGNMIDIFKQKNKAERNFLSFSLFIMFFPKLPMGPLVNYRRFSSMLKKRENGMLEIGRGMGIFVKGLAKKVLLADNLYLIYSAVHSMNVSDLSALSTWIGTISYMLCLYFSLSGISDMGIGIARCFGFRLPQSFNYPSFSMGINDFSLRWHIPVLRWFRRYIVRPVYKKTSNVFLVSISVISAWILIGLWYDFSLNMLVWGVIMGISIMIERIFVNPKTLKATSIFYTFFVISFASAFFFGDNLLYSVHYLLAMIGGNNNIADTVSFYLLKSYVVVLLIGIYAATDLFRNLTERSGKKTIKSFVRIVSPVASVILLAICTAVISFSGESEMLLLNM